MKIFLLRPIKDLKNDPWSPWYDKAFGFVIVAESEDAARKLTENHTGDEAGWDNRWPNPWLDPTLSTCVEVPIDEARMVLRDFASA